MPAGIDFDALDAKLRQWRKRHNTPAKVAAAHRKVLLDRVVESMAFENEPISKSRLKALLKNREERLATEKAEFPHDKIGLPE